MTKNETLVLIADKEEWYSDLLVCNFCRNTFMADTPKFCPHCGRRIVGYKKGNEIVYVL